ncbi:MAG TPA: DUF2846 domain-containing protein [Gallionellaceae bacterium]
MLKKIAVIGAVLTATLLTGCASVPMASPEQDAKAKTFAVATDKANIYLYRNEAMGGAVKMDVVLDGKAIGQTTAKTYIVMEVAPGKHVITSKAENEVMQEVIAQAGKNYFIWKEVKMGVMYARNKLNLVDEATGRAGVAECSLIEGAR